MGKKSTKEDKNIYHISRENANLTREGAADGEVTEDEIPDFLKIQSELERMSLAIDSLKLWVDNTIASGRIDKDLLKK